LNDQRLPIANGGYEMSKYGEKRRMCFIGAISNDGAELTLSS